jgi:N-methylhydantoinase B
MAKKRGKTKVFDFGGTIPELKKRCKRETGLEAPEAPVFQSWNRGDDAGQPKAKRKKQPAAGKKATARKKATAAKKKSGRSTARRRKAA